MAEEKKDYYEILGIKKDSSQEEIKNAYKKLAKKYHPDVSKEGNAEEKFKEVLEAYNVLSDPQKRSNYDQFGHAAEGFSGFRGFGDFGQGFDFSDFSNVGFDFEDLFDRFGFGDIFGREFRRTKHRARKGLDLRYDLSVGFEEAAFGTEKEIELERVEECEKCGGSGSAGKGGMIDCTECGGSGVKETTKRTFFGIFTTRTACRKCRGEGKIVKNPCKECNGLGRIRIKRKIKVKVPEGVDNGSYLRLGGEGNAGDKGAENGDLFVVVFIEPHDFFRRDGTDIFAEIPITFSMAALGGKVKVPTLKEKVNLSIPSGTQTGTIFKLKGKGVKDSERGGYGDEYIKVIVRTPKHLSKKEKELFEQLGKEEKDEIGEDSFFKKFSNSFK